MFVCEARQCAHVHSSIWRVHMCFHAQECLRRDVCVFSRLEFSIIPKGQLQHRRCIFHTTKRILSNQKLFLSQLPDHCFNCSESWSSRLSEGSVRVAWKQCNRRAWEREQFTERVQAYRCVLIWRLFKLSIADCDKDIMWRRNIKPPNWMTN